MVLILENVMQVDLCDIAAAGLLPAILNNLSKPRDFVNFAAVSRYWRTAVSVNHIQPVTLELESSNPDACWAERQWFRQQLLQGRLTRLTELQLTAGTQQACVGPRHDSCAASCAPL